MKNEFGKNAEISEIPEKNSPIIVCSPSYYVALLAKNLREKGFRGQFFTFGSNSNLLTHDLEGCIVVCDLDREDTNPIASDELDHFSKVHKDQPDPSLSTINAMHSLLNVIKNISNEIHGMEVPQIRFNLKNHISSQVLQGLFGPVSFSPQGEMAGNEQISVLKVSNQPRGIGFTHVSREEKAEYYKNIITKKRIILFLSIAGSIASIVSLIIWLIGRA